MDHALIERFIDVLNQAGDLIANVDLDDPSAVRKVEPFHGSFPLLGPPTALYGKVHQRHAASLNAAHMILAGYEHNINQVIQDQLTCLDNTELPFLQWQEYMLDSTYKECERMSSSLKNVEFQARSLRGVLKLGITLKSVVRSLELWEFVRKFARLYDVGMGMIIHASNVRGTFRYLNKGFHKESDVYSFRVLLFEFIAVKNPQQGLRELVELVRYMPLSKSCRPSALSIESYLLGWSLNSFKILA